MALPFTETWTGTNGDPWDADWTTSATSGGAVDIQSNAGRMLTGSGGGYTDYNRATLDNQGAADFDYRLTVGPFPNGGESYTSIWVRTDETWAGNDNPSNGWRLFFATGGSQHWHVSHWESGSETKTQADTGTTTHNTTINVRIWALGSAIKFKFWTGATEPAAWNHETTDSNHTARTGFQLSVHNGAAAAANTNTFDNLAITYPPPIFKAAGAEQANAAGITVPWPTHAVGDVALLLLETCGGEAVNVTNLQGFTALPDSPSSTGTGTNGTRITAYWHRATSTSMSSPSFGDAGNHCYGVILTFLGCIASGNPYDDTAADVKAAASTSMTMPGLTTTVDNSTVVNIAARDNDSAAAAGSSPANADLRGLVEIWDSGTALQNGGGIMAWQGHDDIAGSVTTTTATVTSSINAYLSLNLKPEPPAGDADVSAGVAAATGAANSSTLSLATNGGSGSATGAALTAPASVKVTPVGDPILDENGDPLTDESGNVLRTESAPTAVGQAHNATVSVGSATNVSAGVATATGAANNATLTVAPNGGTGAAAGTANAAAPSIGAGAGSGSGTGSGNSSTGTITVTAGVATATGTAHDATISTAVVTNVDAGVAEATGTANNSTVTISFTSGAGSGTGAANGTTGTVATNPATATSTGEANNSTPNATVNTGTATATGAANTGSLNIVLNAGTGSGAGAANTLGYATVAAGAATATGDAYNANAGGFQTIVAGVAEAIGAGLNATTTVTFVSGTAAATGAGYDADPFPTFYVAAETATATGAGLDADASTAVNAAAITAAATGAGLNAAAAFVYLAAAVVATATAAANQAAATSHTGHFIDDVVVTLSVTEIVAAVRTDTVEVAVR